MLYWVSFFMDSMSCFLSSFDGNILGVFPFLNIFFYKNFISNFNFIAFLSTFLVFERKNLANAQKSIPKSIFSSLKDKKIDTKRTKISFKKINQFCTVRRPIALRRRKYSFWIRSWHTKQSFCQPHNANSCHISHQIFLWYVWTSNIQPWCYPLRI